MEPSTKVSPRLHWALWVQILGAQILDEDIGSQYYVVGKVPGRVVGIFEDCNGAWSGRNGSYGRVA